MVEAGKWSEGDAKLLPLLPAPERTILVVSKIDALKNRDELFAFVSKIMALHPFGAVVPVSATKNQQLDQLLQEIATRLPEGEPMFEEDTLTLSLIHSVLSFLARVRRQSACWMPGPTSLP